MIHGGHVTNIEQWNGDTAAPNTRYYAIIMQLKHRVMH